MTDQPTRPNQADILKARAWMHAHKQHVAKLMLGERDAYPPSGSDCGRPELWKAAHWRWFWERGA